MICLLFLTLETFSQSSDKPVIFPLKSYSLDSSVLWLSRIFNDKITDEVQIVGLGEFTHGGHEPALYKTKMIQYLVKERGYRQLLFEYPDVLLIELNQYYRRILLLLPIVQKQSLKKYSDEV